MKRYELMGKRLSGLANHVKDDGTVTWSTLAAYTLTFDTATGVLKEITHISGLKTQPPQWMPITRDFTLVGRPLAAWQPR